MTKQRTNFWQGLHLDEKIIKIKKNAGKCQKICLQLGHATKNY